MINTILESFDIWTRSQTIKSNGRTAGVDNQRLLGIDKLRELILELAVRGKLVPQDEKDEPADKLLKKISEEKQRLIESGKLKKQEALSKVQESEKKFDIPKSWAWAKLGQISANIHYGYTASANTGISEVRLLRITDIQNDSVNWELVPGCEIKESEITDYKLENGDILIARTGGTIGKSYLVQNINLCAVFASYLIRVMHIHPMNSKFIKVFLGSLFYWNQLFKNSMGTGQPNVNGNALKNLVIPLPPLAEQHRIVAKVDELMVLCDQLEQQQTENNATHHQLVQLLLQNLTAATGPEAFATAWQRIATNFDTLFTTEYSIDQLKQTILQLAVMGKLVPQDPQDEPASELLKKIAKEKERLVREGRIKKQDSNSLILEDFLLEIPSNWSWAKMEELCSLITDGTHQTPQYTVSGRVFISAQNIKPFKFIPENHRYVSEEDYQNYIKNRKPEFGDILLTRVGASIGEAAVNDTDIDFAIYVSVGLLKPIKSFINSHYLTLWLNSPLGRLHSSRNTYGKGVSQGNLNLSLIRNFDVSIPPLAEQHRIVAKVDELFALCDALKERIKEAQETQGKLAEGVVEVN